MRPEFGCRIHEVVFEPFNSETISKIRTYISQALDRWEPRITVQTITITQHTEVDGAVLIEIIYTIGDTYNERSIVYPFYLSGEEAPI